MAGSVQTVTIGAVDYDVYAFTADPVADADEWFAARLGAAIWTAATATQKAQGLVSAKRWLDRLLWSGAKTVSTQDNEFPRDGLTCKGEELADNLVPDGIVWGEFELALILLTNAKAADKATQGSNIKRAKAGEAEVEFFVPTIGTGSDTDLPTIPQQYVACFLAGQGSLLLGFASYQDTEISSEFERDYGQSGPIY